MPAAIRIPPLSSADKRHFGRHNGHELYIGAERQAGHINHRPCNVSHIDNRLNRNGSIGLRNAVFHDAAHGGVGVADIDLSDSDIIFTAVQRRGLGQAGDAMFG